jgi:hypothetical protein
MYKYDEENIIKDLIAMVQTFLPAKIAAINTEKNDALVLPLIANDKYIFETLDSRIMNYKDFFVMYGLIDTPIKEKSNGNVIEDVGITLQIGTFDKGEKERSNTLYKLLRYRRALREIVIENPDVFRGYAKSIVASLKPDAFPFDNNSVILTIGVNVTASITAV